jgi:hypothetical protein
MTPLETMALAKIVSDRDKDTAREHLKPGKYAVDVTCRIHGVLTVGDDTKATPTARAMSLETVATALYYAGCTRQAAIEAILAATLTPSEAKQLPHQEPREIAIAAIVEHVRAQFATLPKEKRRGQVTASLILES